MSHEDVIDCFFVGHNDMDFEKYEGIVASFGKDNPYYRDLMLNFVYENGRPVTLPDIYNRFARTDLKLGISSILNPAIAYLASYIHRAGFTFDFVNSFDAADKARMKQVFGARRVRAVAIPTTLYMSPEPVEEITSFVRRIAPETRIIIGGPFIYGFHISDSMESCWNMVDADVFVISNQGEATLLKLLRALRDNLPLSSITNIMYDPAQPLTGPRRGARADFGAVRVAPYVRENTKLEEHPVEWDLFRLRARKFTAVRTALSCPFTCSFCSFPTKGGAYQPSSVEHVEAELRQIKSIGTVRGIQFIDDTINVNTRRFKNMLRMMIRNKFDFKWNCQFRCQYADREMVELMRESGCEGVFLGIESADDGVLVNMNKKVTLAQYQQGLTLLNEAGIPSHANFIFGFPGETDRSIQNSIDFINDYRPTFYRVQLWYCDPTTPIWNRREQFGIEGRGFLWKHATMTAQEASDHIERTFMSRLAATWTTQYNFEFYGICQLMHYGMDMQMVKAFQEQFNEAIREKLRAGGAGNLRAERLEAMRDIIERGEARMRMPLAV